MTDRFMRLEPRMKLFISDDRVQEIAIGHVTSDLCRRYGSSFSVLT